MSPSRSPDWLPAARAFAEALYATNEGPPPPDRIRYLLDELVDFVAHAGLRSELVLRLGLTLAMWGAPPLIGRAPPLARLSIDERIVALTKLEHSPAGLPLLAVKAIFSIIYYEHPDVLRESGIITPEQEKLSCMTEVKP